MMLKKICKSILNTYYMKKKNQQAAGSLLDDFEYTKDILAEVAGSFKLCDNEKLRSLGYRRISFKFHRYFMLYRVEDTTVYIDGIFMSYRILRIKLTER